MYKIQWKVVDKVYGNADLVMCKLCLPIVFEIVSG